MISIRSLIIAAFVVLLPAGSRASDQPVLHLDLHAPRAEIRKILLGYTPIGSKLPDVVRFIVAQPFGENEKKPQLQPVEDLDAKKHGATAMLRVYIGQYYDQPGVIFLTAPLITEKQVQVEWMFDPNQRLVDIIVSKKSGVF